MQEPILPTGYLWTCRWNGGPVGKLPAILLTPFSTHPPFSLHSRKEPTGAVFAEAQSMIREDEKIKRQEEVKLGLCSGGEPERTSDSSLKGQSRRPAAQCCDSTCTSPGRRVWHLGSSTVWEMPHPSPRSHQPSCF